MPAQGGKELGCAGPHGDRPAVLLSRQLHQLREQLRSALIAQAEARGVAGDDRFYRGSEAGDSIGLGERIPMAAQELRLGAAPARLGVEQQSVEVEDDGTETPRKGGDRLPTSGALC